MKYSDFENGCKAAFRKSVDVIDGATGKVVGTVGGLVVVGQASAASILTAADKTAITGGFTALNDTVLDIVGTSWAPGLSMLAILMAPVIVHKVIKIFSK